MSTRNLPGGKEQQAREADNLTAIREPISRKCGILDSHNLMAFMACYRDSFTFYKEVKCVLILKYAVSNGILFNRHP
jgi:hypothetical protein